jgi:hypothetical protein
MLQRSKSALRLDIPAEQQYSIFRENRMKTSIHTGEVSSPPAQAAGWGVKPGGGTEKRRRGAPYLLANSCDGGIIVKTTVKHNLTP